MAVFARRRLSWGVMMLSWAATKMRFAAVLSQVATPILVCAAARAMLVAHAQRSVVDGG